MEKVVFLSIQKPLPNGQSKTVYETSFLVDANVSVDYEKISSVFHLIYPKANFITFKVSLNNE